MKTGDERAPLRRPWIWLVYGALLAISIPWYREPGSVPRIWLGIPDWALVSLLATLAVAGFTAWVVLRHWPDDEDDEAAP